MARKELIRQNIFPYHVTSRSNDKQWFNLPLEDLWMISKNAMIYANRRFPIELHCFVLMNNHYHMVLTTPHSNIDLFMQAFNKTFSENLKKATGHINRMFGGPYKWSIIESELYLYNIYRYVYQNPLRAEIVNKCEAYPYSTLHYEIRQLPFALDLYSLLEYSHNELCKWYNEKIDHDSLLGIKRGLKHTVCDIKKDRNTKIIPKYQFPKILQ